MFIMFLFSCHPPKLPPMTVPQLCPLVDMFSPVRELVGFISDIAKPGVVCGGINSPSKESILVGSLSGLIPEA
jgi:hypothetical protein